MSDTKKEIRIAGRKRWERTILDTPASRVHKAAQLIQRAARGVIVLYRNWIVQFLDDLEEDDGG